MHAKQSHKNIYNIKAAVERVSTQSKDFAGDAAFNILIPQSNEKKTII